jgi:predicted phage-related endonuclease
MGSKRYRIAKQPHGSQGWLEDRYWDAEHNLRISASPCAAIYDKHPFVPKDAYAAEMLAGVPPLPQKATWAMQRGTDLEPVIGGWVIERTGVEYDEPKEMFCYDTDNGARLIATLDLFYEDGDIRKVVEIKSRNKPWEGELPDYWKFQGIHQAICADVDEILWAVFDSSMQLFLHKQEVTEAEKAEHIAACESWLNSIELGMTPTGVKWTYETVTQRFAEPEPSEIRELPTEAAELLAQLKHVKSELKSYGELEDKLKAELCELIGTAEVATLNGVTVATWKGKTTKRFDQKRFVDENPDVAAQYTKESISRTLILKGDKA